MATSTMDRKLIGLKQKHEIYFIANKYDIPLAVVREAVKRLGTSRRKVYADLRLAGYVIGRQKNI